MSKNSSRNPQRAADRARTLDRRAERTIKRVQPAMTALGGYDFLTASV